MNISVIAKQYAEDSHQYPEWEEKRWKNTVEVPQRFD
jgi:hypothetical protein